MDIAVGQMRSMVIFYQNFPIPDDNGGTEDNFVDVLRTRGRLRQNRGFKSIENGQMNFGEVDEVIIRYRGDLVIDSDTICDVDGVRYRIADVTVVDQIKHEVKIRLDGRY